MKNFLTASLIFLSAAALANPQQPKLDANRAMTPPLISSDVHADRSVTFRISAPRANDVQVVLGNKPTAMTKDDNGIWSATLGPLDPDVYAYAFQIGGARVNAGQFEIAGNSDLVYLTRDVPHGTLTTHAYFSKVQNRRRKLIVYLPPEYYTETTRKFPVLYLYNSSGEEGWVNGNQANTILDNLIAEKKALPMILVMPNNNINDGTGRDAVFPAALDNLAVIEKELQGEIIPMIEKNYRVLADRKDRAITGLSFGAGTSFGMGMRHLDEFANVGEFGTGTFGGADTPPGGHINYLSWKPDNITPNLYDKLLAPSTKPKLFFMAVGDRDPRGPYQKAAYEDFKQHGIDVVFRTYPGGHEGKVFRAALIDYVQLLFK